jgi:hypothetical protein
MLSNGEWHHLLIEYDGHVLRFGVDGYIRETLPPGSVSVAGGAGGAREEEFNSLVGTHFARTVLEKARGTFSNGEMPNVMDACQIVSALTPTK